MKIVRINNADELIELNQKSVITKSLIEYWLHEETPSDFKTFKSIFILNSYYGQDSALYDQVDTNDLSADELERLQGRKLRFKGLKESNNPHERAFFQFGYICPDRNLHKAQAAWVHIFRRLVEYANEGYVDSRQNKATWLNRILGRTKSAKVKGLLITEEALDALDEQIYNLGEITQCLPGPVLVVKEAMNRT